MIQMPGDLISYWEGMCFFRNNLNQDNLINEIKNFFNKTQT